MKHNIVILGLRGIPSIKEGDDLGKLIFVTCKNQKIKLLENDIIVIAHKIVSKSEGRVFDYSNINASPFAKRIAKKSRKEAPHVEAILSQTKNIVRMQGHHLITETRHGFICANSGVDKSNLKDESTVCLLPKDPDCSAKTIRNKIKSLAGVNVAIIISDTFGRPWRIGQVNMAIGIAGMKPLIDYRGSKDMYNRKLRYTLIAIADELASAAELVMKKSERVPVAILRGVDYATGRGSVKDLIRPREIDLFR
ncbi:coenzyme F420-0:L-glutamate ligase [Candidatus Bathyarchaeota archaeon RBG_13_38_9]|nr:MAG: coenzyme F420-0:L-glutamate ligase [Candidatus Bathyarchaeota archaeon RBG_13_38_9]